MERDAWGNLSAAGLKLNVCLILEPVFFSPGDSALPWQKSYGIQNADATWKNSEHMTEHIHVPFHFYLLQKC